MCKDCNSEKTQYKIISRTPHPNGEKWVVKYETWKGCYCNKIEKEAIVQKNTMPLLRDLLKVV